MSNSKKYVFLCAVLAYCLLIIVWSRTFQIQPDNYKLPTPKCQPLVSNKSGNPCIPTKIIIFWNEFWDNYVYKVYGIDKGPEVFEDCNNKNCLTTKDRSTLYNPEYTVSAIVFFGVGIPKNEFKEIQNFKKSKKWVINKNGGIIPKIVLFMQEGPRVEDLSLSIYQNNAFDITMTYRHDSEIYLSYGTFINKTNKEKIKPNAFLKYDEKSHSVFNLTRYKIPELSQRKKGSNFTSKLVQYMQPSKFPRHYIAWLVSNCKASSKREIYVKEMKNNNNGLKVDILGPCGSQSGLPTRASGSAAAYPILAKEYKFYLSFENAKCYDYITEKFFAALNVGILPIALGGLSKQDYEKIAPPHSFIHVDDFSSALELMKFLHQLSNNPKEYNSYFWWRSYYDVSYSTNSKCDLCNILNSEEDIITPTQKYSNFTAFWNKCR